MLGQIASEPYEYLYTFLIGIWRLLDKVLNCAYHNDDRNATGETHCSA